ncbi:hypothetical protein WJX72_010158 [[Myrmecia] bisecta]|uniref:Thylakoid lumenal 17.4 kDa protein, chloroplastic n=1 Tax=[Myrmecia] bisecta TaxID=41462 RepID=A0AAW1PCL1_9CHLO
MGCVSFSVAPCGQQLALSSLHSRRTTSRCSRQSVVRCVGIQENAWQHTPIAALRGGLLASLAAAALTLSPLTANAAVRLPPLDNDPNRCDRAFVGNTIGQANAVSDKVLDLRKCNLHGKDLQAVVLSGALLVDADLSNTNMREVVMSKAYAIGANFSGADMSNSVLDRVAFDKTNFKGVKLVNAILTGTTFEGADLSEADFTEALIGNEDAKRLCLNPTLSGESRVQVGCRVGPKAK